MYGRYKDERDILMEGTVQHQLILPFIHLFLERSFCVLSLGSISVLQDEVPFLFRSVDAARAIVLVSVNNRKGYTSSTCFS